MCEACVCEERRRLLQAYQAAVDRYLDAIRSLLQSKAGISAKESESTREQCEAARRALIAHIQEHGCNS